MEYEYSIILTGGIGSGKSTVGSILTMFGYSIIDADIISHQVLNTKKFEVVKSFGETILDKDKQVDRKKLGKIIFNDNVAKERLQKILHPKIQEEILKQANKLETYRKHYFLDIPLFFEVGGKKNYPMKTIWLVYAPQETQIQRIMKRDSINKTQALQKISTQINIESKVDQSDVIIKNTKGIKELQAQIEFEIKKLSNG